MTSTQLPKALLIPLLIPLIYGSTRTIPVLSKYRNCLKSSPDRRRLWIKRYCRFLTGKRNIAHVLRIRTNAEDRRDQKGQLQIIFA